MLPLQSSVLMCFAKNLLEGKISAGSSKKAPVNRHGSSVRDTAIYQLQDEDVVAPPSAFIASKGMQSRKDSRLLLYKCCVAKSSMSEPPVPFIRASHSRTCSCPTRSYVCLPRSAAV